MDQPSQSSPGPVVGRQPDILEQPCCEHLDDTSAGIEDWIDEADHFYTAAPPAALGFNAVGRSL